MPRSLMPSSLMPSSLMQTSLAPWQSGTEARWATTVRSRPSVSTAMWRLRPLTFLPLTFLPLS